MTIITFQNFSKRRNSTKRPLDSAGTSVDVNLKDSTSIEAPVFELASNDFSINYVKVFGAYYFVTDIVSVVDGIIELHCQKDVLATFKDEIGSYTAFVERAASSYDLDVRDPLISQKQDYIQQIDGALTKITAGVTDGGAYVIRTLGKTGIWSYLATADDVVRILNFTYDDQNSDFITFVSGQLERAFTDPGQYIVDLRWIALSSSMITELNSHPQRQVYLGWFGVTYGGSPLQLHVLDPIGSFYPTPLVYDTYTISVPARYYNDFRDYDPSWTKYRIYVPGCGEHELDSIAVKNGITIDYAVDSITGDVIADVYSGTTDPNRSLLFETKGNVGANVQIGKVSTAGTGIASSIGSQLADYGGAFLSVPEIGTIAHAVVKETPSIIGSVGSRGTTQYRPEAYITKYVVGGKDIPAATSGRPCYRNLQLSTLSGYVLCSGASVEIAGEAGDKDAVNALLNGGFYYE